MFYGWQTWISHCTDEQMQTPKHSEQPMCNLSEPFWELNET